MKFNHWTQKPDAADLSSSGEVTLVYIHWNGLYVSQIKPEHEYFRAGDSWIKGYNGMILLGWIPGNGSFGFSEWQKSITLPESEAAVKNSPVPKNEKRRIRIMDINDEK